MLSPSNKSITQQKRQVVTTISWKNEGNNLPAGHWYSHTRLEEPTSNMNRTISTSRYIDITMSVGCLAICILQYFIQRNNYLFNQKVYFIQQAIVSSKICIRKWFKWLAFDVKTIILKLSVILLQLNFLC